MSFDHALKIGSLSPKLSSTLKATALTVGILPLAGCDYNTPQEMITFDTPENCVEITKASAKTPDLTLAQCQKAFDDSRGLDSKVAPSFEEAKTCDDAFQDQCTYRAVDGKMTYAPSMAGTMATIKLDSETQAITEVTGQPLYQGVDEMKNVDFAEGSSNSNASGMFWFWYMANGSVVGDSNRYTKGVSAPKFPNKASYTQNIRPSQFSIPSRPATIKAGQTMPRGGFGAMARAGAVGG